MDHDHRHPVRPRESRDDWDALYTGGNGDRIWSGAPNGPLVAEASTLTPGKAVDLGCGEGADALWLASRGWDVTGIDISRVAVDRAAEAAQERGLNVLWVCGDFISQPPEPLAFDLVTSHYPALPRSRGDAAVEAVINGVAPGGTLLFVGHHLVDRAYALSHGYEPDDYLTPSDIAAQLDDSWTIVVDEARPRATSAQTPHAEDYVLRALRMD